MAGVSAVAVQAAPVLKVVVDGAAASAGLVVLGGPWWNVGGRPYQDARSHAKGVRRQEHAGHDAGRTREGDGGSSEGRSIARGQDARRRGRIGVVAAVDSAAGAAATGSSRKPTSTTQSFRLRRVPTRS
jgi:hypothetical protein